MRNLSFWVCMVVALSPIGCFASEETMLEAKNFFIESSSKKIGPVSVRGSASDFGMEHLEVTAFNKKFSISHEMLSEFDKLKINGIGLLVDGGVTKGDRDLVVVVLSSVYSAGVVDSGVVTISRSGDIKVIASVLSR